MSRIVTRWTYFGLALLAIGLVIAGVGGATHLDERRCASVGVVQIVSTDELNGSFDGYDRVDFTDLTESEQRVFRSVRAAGGQALADRDAIREAVITYEGETYLVVIGEGSGDCSPWDRDRVITPLVGGLALAIVGGLFLRGRTH